VGAEEEPPPAEASDFVAVDQEFAGGCVGGICDF